VKASGANRDHEHPGKEKNRLESLFDLLLQVATTDGVHVLSASGTPITGDDM
jgi:hypothetical protein